MDDFNQQLSLVVLNSEQLDGCLRGQHSFDEDNDFEECPVCGWVNDGVQRADPDYRGGYNRISLNEAKKKFAEGKKVFD